MLRKKLMIINKLGLHARAAAKVVTHSNHYASQILLLRGERVANGKSIMGVMMLGANKGAEIELIVSGDDEIEAMVDLENLINTRFGEAE